MIKKIVSILLVLFAVSAFWYTYPKKINKTYEGIYFQFGSENSGFEEEITVEINGKYKKRIFGGDIFTGSLKIGETFIPYEKLIFGEIWGGAFMNRSTFSIDPENEISYGLFFANQDLSEISIAVHTWNQSSSSSWNGGDGFMISAPATNRQEALAITNRLFEGYPMDELE
ncbi:MULTISPECIES: hypothetical protein [Bacillus]|uniref:hypothetical protein n=1 Tax=Bacillus TaxID=1386 RepID=UPI000BB7BFD1|nr:MULTISPECIES: hypothetical protein [Bacillus]